MFKANIYRVMISCPADVCEEIYIAQSAIMEWNSTHARIKKSVLLPVHWKYDAYSSFGESPQFIINRQIVDNSDILIAIFKQKLGTPTEQHESGTVEEIDEMLQQKKPILIFFYSGLLPQPDHNAVQELLKLNSYKNKIKNQCLYQEYESSQDLKNKLVSNISKLMNERVLNLQKNHRNEDIEITENTNISIEFNDDEKTLFAILARSKHTARLTIDTSRTFIAERIVSNPSPEHRMRYKSFGEKMCKLCFAEKTQTFDNKLIYELTEKGFDYHRNFLSDFTLNID